jgi:L-asparagine transporter-like permease
LFAGVGIKYIIDSLLPETSSFTLVDSLHTITFVAIFMTLVVSAVSLRFHDNGKTEQSIRMNKIGGRMVVLLYLLLNIGFVVNAII